ncbi:MAG TPA: hypothetical protein VGB37_10750, partial [Candidatus Lokiarchaeia archaeon]
GQELEEGWVYVGVPAKQYKKNRFFEDGLEKVLGHVENVDELRKKYEELYIKRYDKHLSTKEKKEIKKEYTEEEKRRKSQTI